jgi:hypothetical protein
VYGNPVGWDDGVHLETAFDENGWGKGWYVIHVASQVCICGLIEPSNGGVNCD